MKEELFDAYLLKELSAEETLSFENRLKIDNSFQEAFIEHETMVNAVSLMAKSKLKEALKEVHKKEFTTKKSKPIIALIALAAVAILAVLYYSFTKSEDTFKPNALLAEHYEDFPYPSTLRSETAEKVKSRIGKLYKEKQYAQVVQLLDSTELAKDNLHLRLILACAQINQEDYHSAKANLEFVHLSKNMQYSHAGSWYLALAYLKMDNKEKAKSILSTLSVKDSYYADKAKALHSKLLVD